MGPGVKGRPFTAVSSVWYLLEKAAQCKRGLLSAHFKQMLQVICKRWKLRREGMREWKKEGKRQRKVCWPSRGPSVPTSGLPYQLDPQIVGWRDSHVYIKRLARGHLHHLKKRKEREKGSI